MFVKSVLPLILIFTGAVAYADLQRDRQSTVVLDEDIWVTFYDLPSRRFRAIRAAILTRNNESAARDLSVTASYLSVEADRSSATFQVPLRDVVDQLRQIDRRVILPSAEKTSIESNAERPES